MTIINTEHAPGAIGPYSQAYETNGLVITSGQLPVNPADGAMPEGIAAQAEWSCRNVGAILEAAVFSPSSGSPSSGRFPPSSGLRRLCRLQRGVRQVLHLQARPLLRGGEGSAQGRPVRD